MNARHIFFIAVSLCIIFVGNDCFAADTVNSDIIAQVVKSFADKTENWTNIAVKYARMLFYWCAVLQLALLGIEAALGASDIGTTFKKLCMAVFTGGFFFAVITHYSEWSRNIINGMMSIAGEMGGIENSSDNAFKMGIELCSDIWARIGDLSFMDEGCLILGMLIALFISIVCFCLITAQVIFIKCEAFVAMLAACILLGFGTLSIMRDYAVNVLRYILAVAFKLFVMQLVIGIGYSFLKEAVTPQADLPSVCVIIGASIVLLALVKSLPDTVAGIIQGSHIGSGVALQSTEDIEITSMCSVFAESEVISLIANNKEKADIAWGVCRAIAGKAYSLMKRVGLEETFMMTGGVAKNPGVVRAVEEKIQSRLYICPEPEIVGAAGAALYALDKMQA